MKTSRAKNGPFEVRIYYEVDDVESIAIDALLSVDLLPSVPKPIRVERFIEKRFGIYPQYESLPGGVLGFTRFSNSGADEIVISRDLSEEGNRTAARRVNSTLAHEAGHILLHSQLFSSKLRKNTHPMFEDRLDLANHEIQCLSRTAMVGTDSTGIPYDGSWWEYQANMMIGALLLPRPLVMPALDHLMTPPSVLGIKTLNSWNREKAARCLADTFDVNPVVARIRIDGLFQETKQLTL